MPAFKDEIELAQYLGDTLRPNFKEVYANVNLASHKFYDDWEKWWDKNVPPAQPQIDLLFVSSDLRLLAVELKYYRLKKGSVNLPYYSGVGEALALLKFGVTCVSLWHFFDSEIPESLMNRYIRACWGLTAGLALRIGYEAFRVYGRQESGFKEISVTSFSEVSPTFSPHSTINPLFEDSDRKRAQDFIRKALGIPSAGM